MRTTINKATRIAIAAMAPPMAPMGPWLPPSEEASVDFCMVVVGDEGSVVG